MKKRIVLLVSIILITISIVLKEIVNGTWRLNALIPYSSFLNTIRYVLFGIGIIMLFAYLLSNKEIKGKNIYQIINDEIIAKNVKNK